MARSGIVAGGLVSFGILAALVSKPACDAAARREARPLFDVIGLQPEWAAASSLQEVPIARTWVGRARRVPGDRSLFRPRVSYLPQPAARAPQPDRPREAWGFVRSRVEGPFVVRTYFAWGYSAPRKNDLGTFVVWTRSGYEAMGVFTYLTAFGAAVRIDTWATGLLFD